MNRTHRKTFSFVVPQPDPITIYTDASTGAPYVCLSEFFQKVVGVSRATAFDWFRRFKAQRPHDRVAVKVFELGGDVKRVCVAISEIPIFVHAQSAKASALCKKRLIEFATQWHAEQMRIGGFDREQKLYIRSQRDGMNFDSCTGEDARPLLDIEQDAEDRYAGLAGCAMPYVEELPEEPVKTRSLYQLTMTPAECSFSVDLRG